ncbi:MAG: hypothetical protein ACI849_001574 [Patiriisocius sp.]|jgi:hypothetical protein
MKIAFSLFLSLFSILYTHAIAQKRSTELIFNFVYHKTPLALDTFYKISEKDSLSIQQIKLYISDITFLKDGKKTGETLEKYHVLDAQNNLHYKTPYKIKRNGFDTVSFTIGLDAETQKKGIQGGVLDPINGMYWTWQSGFINFKLEGTSSLCTTRKNNFQFHIGGYKEPFQTSRKVSLVCTNSENLNIDINLAAFFEATNISEQSQVMSPNESAVAISKTLPVLFLIHEE